MVVKAIGNGESGAIPTSTRRNKKHVVKEIGSLLVVVEANRLSP